VHGPDPNWARVAKSIGKCSDERDSDESKVDIRFGKQEVYPTSVDASRLDALSKYMRSDTVRIHVTLNTGNAECAVWGCDLTDGYIRINADYTT
ncbi:MAG: bifunctional ornithine acetyltransferase/N-acetylglutamate synthase, partial [Acidimicrobiaceae bacterium]